MRDKHAIMDGAVCRWDDASVYSDDGGSSWRKRTENMTKEHCGEDYQCRCVPMPVVEF